MKKLLASATLIFGAAAALAAGGTGAFFSDTETSTGNTFTAGAIDLKVDNTSYYNGVLNPDTTWQLIDLTIQKFFNFSDIKPADYGEDTISLHAGTNDAYLCANVTLTSNDDNTQTEPEAQVDPNGLTTGELAQAVNFLWWADDGDNVLETGENVISQGPIGALTIGQPFPVTLADSQKNIWNPAQAGGPIPGNATKYIGKAWCFGAIGAAPITQDGVGNARTPAGNNDGNGTAGQPSDGGISCNGASLGNETQTDSLTADVSFSAVQARNNTSFVCPTGDCPIGTTNILVPGAGFETPEVTNGAQWDIFPSGSGGWDVAWRSDVPATFGPQNRPAIANMELHEGVLGPASEGDQYVELDSDWGGPSDPGTGEPASTIISQAITTVPGQSYEIHYAFAARPNTAANQNNVEVRWGGVVVDTTGPTAGTSSIAWTERTINVVATTTSTRVSFGDLGIADSLGSFVDNMRVFTEQCVQ